MYGPPWHTYSMLRSTLLLACVTFVTCSSTQNTIVCHADSDCDTNQQCDNNGQCQKRPITDIVSEPMGCCTSTLPNNTICHHFTDQAHCEMPTTNNNHCFWITTHNPADCIDDEIARVRSAPNATKLIVRGADAHPADIHHCCVGSGGDDALYAQCYDQTGLGRSSCERMPSCVWLETENSTECTPTETASRRRLVVDPLSAAGVAGLAVTAGTNFLANKLMPRLWNKMLPVAPVFLETPLDPKRPQVFIEIRNHFPRHTLYRINEYLEPNTVEQAMVPSESGGQVNVVPRRPDTIPAEGIGIVGLYQARKPFKGIVEFAIAPDSPTSEHLYKCFKIVFGANAQPSSYVSVALSNCAPSTMFDNSRNTDTLKDYLSRYDEKGMQNLLIMQNLPNSLENLRIMQNPISAMGSTRVGWVDDGSLQVRITSMVYSPRKFNVDIFPCRDLGISTTNSLRKCKFEAEQDIKKALKTEATGTDANSANAVARASSAGSFLKPFDREIGDSPHSRHSDAGAKRYTRRSALKPKTGQYHQRV